MHMHWYRLYLKDVSPVLFDILTAIIFNKNFNLKSFLIEKMKTNGLKPLHTIGKVSLTALDMQEM